MALHPPQNGTKLIFSPSGSSNGQAPQFTLGTLSKADLDASPTHQFHTWFSQAQSKPSLISHPETCVLSTANLPSGRVSSRVVYLKELDSQGGFVIYSNFETSRKGNDLATNPNVSLVFWWEGLQRQIRVEGHASRLEAAESQIYYDTRVRGSRIGAWASRQSEVLVPDESVEGDDGRARLEARVREVEERFGGEEKIPVPAFWGGLRIVPDRVEFWQGRQNRLHDRFVYERVEGGEGEAWSLERLSP